MKTINSILLVGFGGFIGAISRYLIALALEPVSMAFPAGTLLVNLTGCLIIGGIAGLVDASVSISPASRLFIVTGFCGALTTMSSFVYETDRIFRGGQSMQALVYFLATLAGSFTIFFAGYFLTKLVFK
jgi:CrcB protein